MSGATRLSGMERLTEGLLWWVILAAVAVMNFKLVAVSDTTALYMLALMMGLFNFFWHHFLPRRFPDFAKTHWEMVVQILLVAGLVNLTGGIKSYFYFVYFLPILTAAVTIEDIKVTWQTASLASLLTLSEALWGLRLETVTSVFTITTMKIFALVTVGAYSGALGRVLLREREEKERVGQALVDRARHLGLIQRISSLINSSLDIQKTFPIMAEEALRVLPFDRISILALSEDGKSVEVIAAEGYGEGPLGKGGSLPLRGTVVEGMLARPDPVFCQELAQEGASSLERELLIKEGVRSFIALPLIAQGRLRGCLSFASSQGKLTSPEDNLGTLRPMAEQVAMAFHNYSQYERVKTESLTDALTTLYNHRHSRSSWTTR